MSLSIQRVFKNLALTFLVMTLIVVAITTLLNDQRGIGRSAWMIRITNTSPEVDTLRITSSESRNIDVTFHRVDANNTVEFAYLLTTYTSKSGVSSYAKPDISAIEISAYQNGLESEARRYSLEFLKFDNGVAIVKLVNVE